MFGYFTKPIRTSRGRLVASIAFRYWWNLGLAALIVAAAVLRGQQLNESLWIDELHTAWTVADGGPFLAERAEAGNQTPAYFLLPWVSSMVLGMSEPSLRLPSLLANLTTIGLIGALVRRLTGSTLAGFFAAWLMTLDRHSWFYSQEARVYALVQLVAMIHMLVLLRVVRHGGVWARALLVFGAVLLLYLHFTTVLLLAGEVAFIAMNGAFVRSPGVYRLREFLFDAAIVVVFCVPTTPQLSLLLNRRANWEFFVDRPSVAALFTLFPLGTYAALPAIGVAIDRLWSRCPGPPEPVETIDRPIVWGWLASWFAVPMAIAWICTATDLARIFFARYLIACSAAPIVFAGICLARCRRPVLRWAVVGAVTAASIVRGGYLDQYRYDGRLMGDRRQDWRGAVAFVNQQLESDNPLVFLRSGLIEARTLPEPLPPDLREYLQFPVRGLYRLQVADDRLRILPAEDWLPLRLTHRRDVAQATSVWLIVNSSTRTLDEIRLLWREELAQTGGVWHIQAAKQFGELHVVGGVKRPAKEAP